MNVTDALLLALAAVALAGYWPMSRKIRDWQIATGDEADRADRADERAKGWREYAESLEVRAREDASRIATLRKSLDAANSCNSHFVEWATEKPVDPHRGGESS